MSALTHQNVDWRRRSIELVGMIKVIIPATLLLPLMPRLSPRRVLEEVQQISPDCVPVGFMPEGAKVFAKWIESGGVLLKWPDGVAILSCTANITPQDGLHIYFYTRTRLEDHVAKLEVGVL